MHMRVKCGARADCAAERATETTTVYVQRGALRVEYPDLYYSEALLTNGLDTLRDRRETSADPSL